MTRKEAQKIAKEARALALAKEEAVEALEDELEIARSECDKAFQDLHAAESAAAAVPPGSIVEVPLKICLGKAYWNTRWIKAGYYESGTRTNGGKAEVYVIVDDYQREILPRGKYRVVWTPWMKTPKPDLDELNGKAGEGAGGKSDGGEP